MEERELISKLQGLRQIKPRTEWVALSKMQIINSAAPAPRWSLSDTLGLLFQRKLAYAFAVLLFVFAGVAGLLNYQMNVKNVKQVAGVSQADVLAETTVKNSVEDLKEKSQTLAEVSKNKLEDPKIAIQAVKTAAKKLATTIQKNPELAKTVALDVNNNTTYLDIAGENKTNEITDMYKAIDEQLIKDIEKTTLTKEQTEEFVRIKESFKNGTDYSIVLRDILLMNASRDSKTN